MARATILLGTFLTIVGMPGTAGGQTDGMAHILPASQQIAGAVTALPEEMRDRAAVLGYSQAARLVSLRHGTNDMLCLADDPNRANFHVACYHTSLEPFMARGRELTAKGITGARRDSIRNTDVTEGRIEMPAVGALYTLTGPPGSFDPATGTVTGGRPLHSIYIPFATAESTGLSPTPKRGQPWIMLPGTPKAHIMFGAHDH